MLEDLIMLSSYGIDTVREMEELKQPSGLRYEDSDDENDLEEIGTANGKRNLNETSNKNDNKKSRLENNNNNNNNKQDDDKEEDDSSVEIIVAPTKRLKKLKRNDKNYEIARAWEDYDMKKELLDEVNEEIEQGFAADNWDEKKLRQLVKKAARAGHKWTANTGAKKTICSFELKTLYKVLYQFELKAKEEKETATHEKALALYSIRVLPLGQDRFGANYWMFPGCEDKLFVERISTVHSNTSTSERHHSNTSNQVSSSQQSSSSSSSSGRKSIVLSETDKILKEFPTLNALFQCRPAAKQGSWSYFDSSTSALWRLCETLNPIVEAEKLLKASILAHYEVTEPPPPFQTTGSEYIGQAVKRVFGKRSVIGKIIGWWPAEGDDPALWHVKHVDGDEEDLELHEIKDSLVDLDAMDVDSGNENGSTQKEQSIANENDDKEKKEEEEEPDIIQSFPLFRRNYTQIRENAIGLSGLQSEVLSVEKKLLDGLKKRGSDFQKKGKLTWEEMVKNAFSLNELIGAISELENVVHELQEDEDVNDDEEIARNHARKVKTMTKEGWIFENSSRLIDVDAKDTKAVVVLDTTSPTEVIGVRVRQFFSGYGFSDGTIVAYLPAEKNEGMALWHVEHDDGDEEDMEEADVEKGLRMLQQNAQEDDASVDDDNDNNNNNENVKVKENDEEDDDDNEEEEEEEEEEDQEEEGNKKAPAHLWPTTGVRAKWRSFLCSSKTVGEVALALKAFARHAQQFGIMSEESADIIDLITHGNTELKKLLRDFGLKSLNMDGRQSNRRRKSARRKSFFYG